MAIKPDNFGGSQAAYDRYLETQAERKQYNLDTFDQRQAAKSAGEYWGGYDDQSNSGSSGSYSNNPYDVARRKSDEAIAAAIEKNAAAMLTQKDNVSKQYGDMASQSYVNYRQAQQKLPQQLGGVSTGAADSLMLQGNLNYQNSLNSINDQKAQSLTQIDRDVADLRATGDINIAQNAEKYALLAIEQAQAEKQRQQDLDLQYAQLAKKAATGSSSSGLTSSQRLSIAKELAKVGDFSGYAGLLSDDQINSMVTDYNKTYGSSDSGVTKINPVTGGMESYGSQQAVQSLINYYLSKGYSEQQIADILNQMN